MMRKHVQKLPPNLRQFIKFCIVGTISLVVNMVVYGICTRFFLIYYLASDVIAYLVALVNSYILNRRFTFRNNHKKVGVQFAKYTIVYTVGMGLSVGLLYVFVDKFGVYDLLAKIIVIGIVTIWNFIGSKFLIFDRDERRDASQ